MPTEELKDYAAKYLMQTYARQPISIVRGRGAKVYDMEGREYIDFVGGIAVNILGHGHPDLVQAIQRQAAQLIHVSNLYYTEPQVRLAQMLVDHSCADRVFFCNSGAEANEAAIKLARRYGHEKHGANRFEIITMKNSFHGRTMATLTATGQEKVQKGFEPLVPGFVYAPFNDFAAIESLVTEKTTAIMLEPIQGEGGVHVADQAYLKNLRELCTQKDILLIFDEVQTGMGRTGTLFAYEQLGVEPDIMTLAKGLGGGMPIGACLAKEAVAAVFTAGSHASTFGGNPLACAAGLAVCRILIEGRVLEQARRMGDYLAKGLADFKDRHRAVRDVRGLGLLQGLEVEIDAKAVVADCLSRGVLVNATSERVLRFVPPLIISQAEIDRVLETLSSIFNQRTMAEKDQPH
ncbi:MAG: acetylornithine transaminase [Nitrospiraceae bacterium]|jgi:acetylornithine aminotransferase|nr:acetylornithine transaminase [Nitrospiraceae bacterium]MDP3090110.1 acetylornithine transaminase [Nitrospira sp.]